MYSWLLWVIREMGELQDQLYFVRCTPYKAGDPDICDGSDDWGDEINLTEPGGGSYGVEGEVTKLNSDTAAIDLLVQGELDTNIYYERIYTDLNDRKV